MILSSRSGLRIDTRAAKSLGGGGEGKIYEVPKHEGLAAKVYEKIEPWTTKKLEHMLRYAPPNPTQTINHLSYTWPIELLLDEGGLCAGYVMPRLKGFAPLVDLYTASTRRTKAPEITYKHLVNIAVNLCSAFEALHANGYVVGDVNQTNVFVSPAALPTLIDTDSFQVRDPNDTRVVFRCRVMKPDFTPRELFGADLRQVDRSPSADLFGLAVLVYHLLMEGAHPFAGKYLGLGSPPLTEDNIRHGDFPHAARRKVKLAPKPGAPPFSILAPDVRRLFLRCFEDGHEDPLSRPTAQEWKLALMKVLKGLYTCPSNPRHFYSSHLGDGCAWCERQKQLKGYDVFPAPGALLTGTPAPPPATPSSPAISTSAPSSVSALPASSSPSHPPSRPSSPASPSLQNMPSPMPIPGLRPKRSTAEIAAWIVAGMVGVVGVSYWVATPRTNVARGETCSWSTECAPSLVCIEGKCAEKRGIGGRCNYDESCQTSLVCSSGICLRVNVPVDGACSFDKECLSSLTCKDGKCAKAPKKLGEDCSSNGECQSPLRCAEGRCAEYKKLGAPCDGDLECWGGLVCAGGACDIKRTPAPADAPPLIKLVKGGEPCSALSGELCEPGLSCLQSLCGVAEAKANERCAMAAGCVIREEPKIGKPLTAGGPDHPVCYIKPNTTLIIVERLPNNWRKVARPSGCPRAMGYMHRDVLNEVEPGKGLDQ